MTDATPDALPGRVLPTADALRRKAAGTVRVNAEVALLCEAAIGAALALDQRDATIERLTADLRGATHALSEHKEWLRLETIEVGLAQERIDTLTAERDAALARAEAAERDAARALSMYRALRERMQAAMQETIEEQPR